jgi:hypothetical protein
MCCYASISLLFSGIMCSGDVQILGSEFSGTPFGECYVITVLWDVTWLTFVSWTEQRYG